MVTDIFSTDKSYSIIYADPPWSFKTYSEKGKVRSAERHYPTMQKADIQRLPIERLAAKNAELWDKTKKAVIEDNSKTRSIADFMREKGMITYTHRKGKLYLRCS